MTVVVVAGCFLPAFGDSPAGASGIVGIADRKLSTDLDWHEPKMGKHFLLTPTILCWYAGDPIEALTIMRASRTEIQGLPTVEEAAGIVARVYASHRLHRAIEEIVVPHGFTFDKNLPANLRRKVARFEIDCQLIVGGVDQSGSPAWHIYRVLHPGRSRCEDVLGYAVMGSGNTYAARHLERIGFGKSESLANALNAIYTAKRLAEVSHYVGAKLDFWILGPQTYINYDRELTERLELSYDHVNAADRTARDEAVGDIAAFLNRQPDGGLPLPLWYGSRPDHSSESGSG